MEIKSVVQTGFVPPGVFHLKLSALHCLPFSCVYIKLYSVCLHWGKFAKYNVLYHLMLYHHMLYQTLLSVYYADPVIIEFTRYIRNLSPEGDGVGFSLSSLSDLSGTRLAKTQPVNSLCSR